MKSNPPQDAGILAGKRIGLITASASRLGGGVFEAVVRQSELIRMLGGDPVVFALSDQHANADGERFGECELFYLPVFGPAQVGYAPGLVTALDRSSLDCLHLHGIWMYPSRAAAVWARRTGKPYFISPHGMLDPWILSGGRWKKTLARLGYERDSWRRAQSFHALTENEAADIANATGSSRSFVIPNAAPALGAARIAPPTDQRFVYLGRIHPKKNLTALIDAWESLVAEHRLPEGAELTIAGWGETCDVAALEARLARSPAGLRFAGPVFGEDKRRLIADSRALILPSLGEGLPMVVLEAWAAATPVLMSDRCHLPEGFTAGAALDCGTETGAIAAALLAMVGLDQTEWLRMSAAARGLANGPFSASAIAARWGAIYARAITEHAVGQS